MDEDILRDHQALAYVGGIIKVPDDMRFKGMDGFERHGDTAIAGCLMWFASQMGPVIYEYIAAGRAAESPTDYLFPEYQTGGRSLW